MAAAPASSVARATAALTVSTVMITPGCRRSRACTTAAPRELDVGGHCLLSPWPRGFPADVEDGRSCLEQRVALGQRRIHALVTPAVAEAVRRDVEDPHEHGPVECDRPPGCLPHVRRLGRHREPDVDGDLG